MASGSSNCSKNKIKDLIIEGKRGLLRGVGLLFLVEIGAV